MQSSSVKWQMIFCLCSTMHEDNVTASGSRGKFCSLGYLTRNCILFVDASRAKRFSAEWAEMSAMDNSHRIEKHTRVTTLSWSRLSLPLFRLSLLAFYGALEKVLVSPGRRNRRSFKMSEKSTEKFIFKSRWKIMVERKKILGCIRFLKFLSKNGFYY